MPLFHLQSRKHKSRHEIENKRSGQDDASVQGDLEGHEESGSGTEDGYIQMKLLSSLRLLRIVVHLPGKNVIGPDGGRFNPDGDKTIGSQIKRLLHVCRQRENAQAIGAKKRREDLIRPRV